MTDEHGLFDEANVIFTYTTRQAIDDGLLLPFVTNSGDTHHCITANAFHELREYHDPRRVRYETDQALAGYVLHELLPLVPEAFRVYEQNIGGGILKTDYDFEVMSRSDDVLWYIPNEVGGITILKPEDY